LRTTGLTLIFMQIYYRVDVFACLLISNEKVIRYTQTDVGGKLNQRNYCKVQFPLPYAPKFRRRWGPIFKHINDIWTNTILVVGTDGNRTKNNSAGINFLLCYTQKSQSLLSSKTRAHYQTHKYSWSERKKMVTDLKRRGPTECIALFASFRFVVCAQSWRAETQELKSLLSRCLAMAICLLLFCILQAFSCGVNC
jgi:hypothetical protein